MKTVVQISKKAEKQIDKAPIEIIESIIEWVSMIETIGLEQVRKNGGKGLHDEALKGKLRGTRSIRLNKAWRLYYKEERNEVILVNIIRIDKHEY